MNLSTPEQRLWAPSANIPIHTELRGGTVSNSVSHTVNTPVIPGDRRYEIKLLIGTVYFPLSLNERRG